MLASKATLDSHTYINIYTNYVLEHINRGVDTDANCKKIKTLRKLSNISEAMDEQGNLLPIEGTRW